MIADALIRKASTALLLALLPLALILNPLPAHAQKSGFPKQPIRLIVPYPPGGGADGLARLIAQGMGEYLGQQVIVDNKPGANTVLATEMAAKMASDGYSLLYVASSFAINPSLYKLSYSIEKDFSPVAMIAKVPLIIVANNDYPVNTVSELVKLAKSQPGQITYASYGAGSPVHLAGELFCQLNNITMLHVPYKGSSPAMTDLMSGQVNLAFSSIEPAMQLIKTNRIKPIAVTTAQRVNGLLNVPTIAESGLKDFDVAGWNGIVAPANLPPDITNILNQAVNSALKQSNIKNKMDHQGVVMEMQTPEQFGQFIRSDSAKWAAVIKKANIKLD